MMRRLLVGASFTLSLSAVVLAKPPALPLKPGIDNEVPSPMVQDFYEVEKSKLETGWRPGREEVSPKQLAPMAQWLVSITELTGRANRADSVEKVDELFREAEGFYHRCETDEANKKYRAVIELAPKSNWAEKAKERMRQLNGAIAPQTKEPPLAPGAEAIDKLKLISLVQAVKAYKLAVEAGDEREIEYARKVLEQTLKLVEGK